MIEHKTTLERLEALKRERDAAENAEFRKAFAETRDLTSAVERVRGKRGGARPGAGRKLGSGAGRKDAARLQFNVSEEFKRAFEERAAAEGVSRVELLRRLFVSTR